VLVTAFRVAYSVLAFTVGLNVDYAKGTGNVFPVHLMKLHSFLTLLLNGNS
jgi:hypothetical protein